VTTRELAAAVDRLRRAQRCVADRQEDARRITVQRDAVLAGLARCRLDAARAQADVDRATEHQRAFQLQLSRVEYTLSSGGQQKTLPGGSKRELDKERRRLKSILEAAPG
jgi:hypothetical protein